MKNWQKIAIVLAIAIFLYLATYVVPMPVSLENTPQSGIRKVRQMYGPETAKIVEQILRLETNHFKSGGWEDTRGAGMHPTKPDYPYGWPSLRPFWDQYPKWAPTGIKTVTETQTGKPRQYLTFEGIGGIMTLAERMSQKGNNAGAWYSLDQSDQDYYNSIVNGIKTQYA